MKRQLGIEYISIAIALVAFSLGVRAEDASPPTTPASTEGPSLAPPSGDISPSLEINVPPPPESPLQRRWRERNRLRPNDEPAPKVFPVPGDGTLMERQWTVETPRGTMTQTLEASRSEERYSLHRQHIWTAPDGTLIRSQETDVTASGPNNYQADRTITLRDGRTIEHSYSRSWDGETLHTERSFSGPNGQTWSREHTWTPGSEETPRPDSPPPPSAFQDASPGSGVPAGSQKALPEISPGNRFGQRADAGSSQGSGAPAPRPSGFTLGSSGRGWAVGHGSPTRPSRPPETTPSLGKRLRVESPTPDRPGALRPSILPRPRGRR